MRDTLRSIHARRTSLQKLSASFYSRIQVGDLMSRFSPDLSAVQGAVKAAFGGERSAQDFEKKMQRMEQELDSKVELRAKQLEPLAEAMCERLKTLDRIDDELEFRLPDGGRLELLRVGPRAKD